MEQKLFREYNLHGLLLSLWIRQAVYHEGTLKVTDGSNRYVVVNAGKYMIYDNGLIKRQEKASEKVEHILHGLIEKYGRIERNGYEYVYQKGRWLRKGLFQ